LLRGRGLPDHLRACLREHVGQASAREVVAIRYDDPQALG
jgi:hypothetical protein